MRLLIDCDRRDWWAKQIGQAPRQRGSGHNGRNNEVRTDHFLGLFSIRRIASLSWQEPLPGITDARDDRLPLASDLTDGAAGGGPYFYGREFLFLSAILHRQTHSPKASLVRISAPVFTSIARPVAGLFVFSETGREPPQLAGYFFSSTSYSKATPSGSCSSNQVSAASAFAKILR